MVGSGVSIEGYEELVEIGRGNTAVRYRTRGPGGRDVVLKILTMPLTAESRQDFIAQRTTVAALSEHPYILAEVGSGFVEDRAYVVTEDCVSESAADRIAHGPPSWLRAATVGEKLAGALAAAHRVGLTHGDIKPENVLFTKSGAPMLSDFGLARLAGGPETLMGISIELAYVAPELIDGGRPSERADIYSLAATVHALAVGSPPYATATTNPIELVARIASEPLPDLRDLGVPDSLAEVLRSALAKEPAARPSTVDELQQQFAKVVSGRKTFAVSRVEPGSAPPEPAADDAAPDKPRRRLKDRFRRSS